jgi:hypothetical protein
MNKHKYTPEQRNFLKEFTPGHSREEITQAFNSRFKTDLKVSQITGFIKNNKLNTGRNGHFQKGHKPANKGKHGNYGHEPTQFKKGQIPHNHLPIGTEIMKSDGYLWVKIAEPGEWKQKHKVIWEEANGPIPKNHVLIFADGNKSNVCLENLLLASRREMLVMNRKKLITKDKDLTQTGLLVAGLLIKTYEVRK